MLIQGGTISSGRFSTVAVDGAYWMSCMRSFWKITLPGVDRQIAADLEHRGVRLADPQVAAAGFDVLGEHAHAANEIVGVAGERLAQQFGIGEHEVRRRQRVGDLPHVELGLLLRVRIEPGGVADQWSAQRAESR